MRCTKILSEVKITNDNPASNPGSWLIINMNSVMQLCFISVIRLLCSEVLLSFEFSEAMDPCRHPRNFDRSEGLDLDLSFWHISANSFSPLGTRAMHYMISFLLADFAGVRHCTYSAATHQRLQKTGYLRDRRQCNLDKQHRVTSSVQ